MLLPFLPLRVRALIKEAGNAPLAGYQSRVQAGALLGEPVVRMGVKAAMYRW